MSKSFFDEKDIVQGEPSFFDEEDVVIEGPKDREVSALKALGLGAAQGATFGFSDEIEAAGRTILDDIRAVVSGDSSEMPGGQVVKDEFGRVIEDTTGGTYRQNLEQARQKYREAQEQRPLTSLAGELVGSLSVPVPLLGMAAPLARTSGFTKAAATGGVGGALYGAGASEEQDLLGVGQDVLASGAIGAAGGGVLGSTIPAVVGGVSKLIKTAPVFRQAGEVFSRAKTGAIDRKNVLKTLTKERSQLVSDLKKKGVTQDDITLILNQGKLSGSKKLTADPEKIIKLEKKQLTPEQLAEVTKLEPDDLTRLLKLAEQSEIVSRSKFGSEEQLVKTLIDTTKETEDFLTRLTGLKTGSYEQSIPGFISKQFDDAIEIGVKKGVTGQSEDVLNPLSSVVGIDAQRNVQGAQARIKKATEQLTGEPFAEVDANTLKEIRNILSSELSNANLVPEARDALTAAKRKVDDFLSADPASKIALERGKFLRDLQKEIDPILGANRTISSIREKAAVDRDRAFSEIRNAAKNIVNKWVGFSSDVGTPESVEFLRVRNALQEFAKQGMDDAPTLIAKLDSLIERAGDIDTQRQILNAKALQTGIGQTLRTGGMSIPSIYLRGAVAAGKMTGNVASTKVVKLVDRIANLPKSEIIRLAERSQNKTVKEFLNQLATGDAKKRRALTLTLAQQPGLRDALKKDFSETEAEEDQ